MKGEMTWTKIIDQSFYRKITYPVRRAFVRSCEMFIIPHNIMGKYFIISNNMEFTIGAGIIRKLVLEELFINSFIG